MFFVLASGTDLYSSPIFQVSGLEIDHGHVMELRQQTVEDLILTIVRLTCWEEGLPTKRVFIAQQQRKT